MSGRPDEARVEETRSVSSVRPAGIEGPGEVIGRYVLYAPIARGGMATVHLARLIGAKGFSRVVAAKRLHPQFTQDADFVTMFLDEAHIASKIHHPYVVPVLDVIHIDDEIILVQEYVHGVPLDRLIKAANEQGERIPIPIAVAIAAGVLGALQAAHETEGEHGERLDVVHRDVSPQNIMVSVDGAPRLLDFGIAKARSSVSITREGHFKGKIGYMSPEQLIGEVTSASDLYSLAVVLWEMVVGARMHAGRTDEAILGAIINGQVPTVVGSVDRAAVGPERWAQLVDIEPTIMRALAREVENRYVTANEMCDALRNAAPRSEVAAWAKRLGARYLAERDRALAVNETHWRAMQKNGLSSFTDASGIQLAYRTSGVPPAFEATNPTLPTSPSAVQVLASSRFTPVVVALLLLVTGVLAGVVAMLVTHRNEDSTGRAVLTPPVVTSAVAVPLAAPSLPIPAPTEMSTTNAPPFVVSPKAGAAAPARPSPRGAPPALRSRPAPPPAAASVVASPTKSDCSPPFYYEGTKKVYKPGCL